MYYYLTIDGIHHLCRGLPNQGYYPPGISRMAGGQIHRVARRFLQQAIFAYQRVTFKNHIVLVQTRLWAGHLDSYKWPTTERISLQQK